jgi:hypothetical protein
MRHTPETNAYEIGTHEMPACEMHVHKTHAHKIRAHKKYACETYTHETRAYGGILRGFSALEHPSHTCPSSSEGFGVVVYRFQSSCVPHAAFARGKGCSYCAQWRHNLVSQLESTRLVTNSPVSYMVGQSLSIRRITLLGN